MSRILSCLLAASLAIALPGCTSTKPSSKQFSGFLSDYSKLEERKTPSGQTALAWISPDLRQGKYTAIMIDPVGFYPRPPVDSQVPVSTMLKVSEYLTAKARQSVSPHLRVTDKPGPGVLRWDAAITGVSTPMEGMKAYEIIPIAAIFAGASAAAGTRDRNTVVYLEARLVDSQTGRIMAKSVRKGLGTELENSKTQMTLDNVKPVLDMWASDAGDFVRTRIK